MAVTIKIEGGVFDRETLDECLKTLSHRDFVDNNGHQLTYSSRGDTITMSGEIAAAAGQEPTGWDLNNSQIHEMTFSHGSQTVSISGLAMSLREIYPARTIDELRDWNDFTKRQDYEIIGSSQDDIIKASLEGRSIISGHAGDDRLVSLGNNDKLLGGAGDDTLVLRSHGAWARGDAGRDSFVLRDTETDTKIMDFEAGRDRLVLGFVLDMIIRGNHNASQLRFIGDDDFGHGRYEMRTDVRHVGDDTFTVLEVSVKGHEHALVEFDGALHLSASDVLF